MQTVVTATPLDEALTGNRRAIEIRVRDLLAARLARYQAGVEVLTVRLLDVHGAGAQRSDPKAGNPADYPHGRGPQGDVIRIFNYVRCVRNAR